MESEDLLLKIKTALDLNEIFTRRYFYPSLSSALPYLPKQEMQVSDDIAKRVLCLPLFDSPPIGLVSDSYDLLKFVDATLYITRYNYSERNFLKVFDAKYKEEEITNVGIILNDFQVKMGYGYGYGNEYGYGVNYGYGYGYGYFEEDEYYENNWVGKIKRFFDQFTRKKR